MLAVLFTVGWMVLTSNWFLRAALLPKVNHALNATVRFENAEWTLGSQLRLEGVTLHATGEHPLLTAARVEVNYQWRDLFAGRMEFGQIACEEPELFLHIDRNGKPNYAPLLDRPRSDSENKPIRIENFSVTNARVEYRRDHQSGSTETAHFSGLHIVSSEIAAGQPGQITVQGRAGYSLKPLQQSGQGLAGEFHLKFIHQLDEHLLPTRVESEGYLQVALATGQFAFAAGLKANLNAEATADELRRFALNFTHAGNALGRLDANGTLQPAAGGADMTVALHRMDQRVLDFIGRPVGLDFHSTVLNSTNRVRVLDFGKSLEVYGTMRAQPLHLSTATIATPPLEIGTAKYALKIDTTAHTALLDTLDVSAIHEGHPLLVGKLDQPMQFDWSTRGAPVGESFFTLTTENINLADWQPWLGEYATEGHVSAGLRIHFQEAGRRIGFAVAAKGIGLQLEESDLRTLPASLRANGVLQDFRQLTLTQYSLDLGSTNAPVLNATGHNVQCNLREQTLSGYTTIRADLARMRPWISRPPEALSGTLDFNGTVTAGLRAPQFQTAKGQLQLADFTFQNRHRQRGITNIFTRANLDLRLDEGRRLAINSLGAHMSLNGREIAPYLTAIGKWDLHAGVVDLSQVALKDFKLGEFAAATGITQFTNGVLAATVSVKHTPGKQTQVGGNATFSDARQPGWPASVTFTANGEMTVDEGRTADWPISMRDFRIEFPRGDVLDGELQITGGWHPQTGAAEFTLAGAELDHRLLAPWLAGRDRAFEWAGGKLKWPGKTRVKLDGQGGGTWRGLIHGSGLLAEARDFDWPKAPMNAELFLDYSRTVPKDGQPVNTVREASLKVMLPDKTAARLRFSGQHEPGANRWRVLFQPPAEKEKGFINHQLLQPLLGKKLAPRKLIKGVLQHPGRLEISSVGQGGFQVKGDVELAEVRMEDPNGDWPDKVLSATATLDLARQSVLGTHEWRMVSNGTRGLIFINNKHSGTFSVKGDFNSVRRQGKLDWNFRNLDQLALAPLSDLLGGPAFRTIRVKLLKGSLRLDETGNGHMDNTLITDQVRLMDDPERAPGRSLILNLKGGATNHVYHLNHCSAELTATNAFNGRSSFTVAGKIDLCRPAVLSGQLKISSKSIDVTALQALIKKFRRAKPSPVRSVPASPRAVFLNFQWDLDVKQLRWFDLTATDVVGAIVLDGRKVHLKPLEMKLFGGSVMADGWIVPNGNSTRIDLQLSSEHLPLTPLARRINPALDRNIDWGKLTLHTHVKADALSGDKLRQTLSIRGIDGKVANLEIHSAKFGWKKKDKASGKLNFFSIMGIPLLPLDQLSGGIITEFGTLNLNELDETYIEDIILELNIEKSIIRNRLSAKGPLIGYKTEGRLTLSSEWRESQLQQPLKVNLLGRLAKKLEITGGLLIDENKHYPINITASLGGPLVQPKSDLTELSKFKLGSLRILGKPAELIERVIDLPGHLFNKIRGVFD